jgi:hypothetical protein
VCITEACNESVLMAGRDETEEWFDTQYRKKQHLWLMKGCYNIIRGCFASLFTSAIPEIYTERPKRVLQSFLR